MFAYFRINFQHAPPIRIISDAGVGTAMLVVLSEGCLGWWGGPIATIQSPVHGFRSFRLFCLSGFLLFFIGFAVSASHKNDCSSPGSHPGGGRWPPWDIYQRLGVLNREIVSFHSCVRTRGLVA